MIFRYRIILILLIALFLKTATVPVAAVEFKIDSVAEAYAAQARRCWERGETAHAAKLYEQALEQEVKDENDELRKGALHNNLGECYRRMASEPLQQAKMEPAESESSCLAKAADNLKEALRVKEERSGPSTNFLYIAVSLENLANVYMKQSNTMEAEALYRKAIAIRQDKEGTNSTSCASDYLQIGELLTTDRHFTEAQEALKKGLALYSISSGPTDNVLAVCHQKLAKLYFDWNKIETAGDEYDKAKQIFSRNPSTAKKYLAALEAYLPNFPALSCSDATAKLQTYETSEAKNPNTRKVLLASAIKAMKRVNAPASDIKFLQNQLIR